MLPWTTVSDRRLTTTTGSGRARAERFLRTVLSKGVPKRILASHDPTPSVEGGWTSSDREDLRGRRFARRTLGNIRSVAGRASCREFDERTERLRDDGIFLARGRGGASRDHRLAERTRLSPRAGGLLADATRREILILLREGELSAGRMCELLALPRHQVWRHVVVLADAGLVVSRPDGKRRLYRIEPKAVLAAWDDYLGRWDEGPTASSSRTEAK
ncbi:MAG TPA: metalloregulator ArsR/SmtB family transcription factor [Planctomycetota bacterium]|nr:metalloregulator ArsR/SmtB family transcription factor [Planctomycetota bacterium]